MKEKTYLACILTTLIVLTMEGCTASVTTNTAKPGNTAVAATSPASKPAANTALSATTGKKTDSSKPTEKLKDEKKPEGEKGKVANAKVEVPKDWIDVYDATKGYSFSVPEGTTGGQETQDGVDTFVASTPAPTDAAVVVITFKDKKMTKEDLLDVAVKFLEEMGAKVQPGKLTGESADYSLAEATSTLADGSKSKCKILVGTDVTDNYVMIVGTEEAKFAANEKVIDEIWGSFEMWSGGASGKN